MGQPSARWIPLLSGCRHHTLDAIVTGRATAAARKKGLALARRYTAQRKVAQTGHHGRSIPFRFVRRRRPLGGAGPRGATPSGAGHQRHRPASDRRGRVFQHRVVLGRRRRARGVCPRRRRIRDPTGDRPARLVSAGWSATADCGVQRRRPAILRRRRTRRYGRARSQPCRALTPLRIGGSRRRDRRVPEQVHRDMRVGGGIPRSPHAARTVPRSTDRVAALDARTVRIALGPVRRLGGDASRRTIAAGCAMPRRTRMDWQHCTGRSGCSR